ncbi:MAG: pantoate--beta-alanine ligase [Chitinophagales bacterium]|jgi:pantoate--beta-alanine ligase|nr:pantoate--beta-alanine ligase [Sphingobacteriales bacterium]
MLVFNTVEDIQYHIYDLKSNGKTIGFVPTMGALHEGHLSLIRRSKAECDITVASIFVNPTQFNDQKDFDKYPRMNEADSQMLEKSGCDVLFLPDVVEMYQNSLLEVQPFDIGYLDTILEGAKRPGHYQGVATIVEKLFLSVLPDKVFMGLKDFQQVKVIEKLVRDKNMQIEIIGCPTLRETNGLAMSSRNMRLSEDGKQKASDIYQVLVYIKKHRTKDNPERVLAQAKEMIASKGYWNLEYLELRHAHDLSEIDMEQWQEGVNYVALYAGWLEGVRLIDNMSL